jgi:hypothetical protein
VPTRGSMANLPKQVVDTLHELARKRGTTQAEILCHAISVEREFDTERDLGTSVLRRGVFRGGNKRTFY